MTSSKPWRIVDEHTWKPIHTSILTYISRGTPVAIIAQQLDVSRNFVYITKNSPYFKQKLSELTAKTVAKVSDRLSTDISIEVTNNKALLDQARSGLEQAAVEAVEKIKILARRGTTAERVQLEACKDILDRVNIKGKDTIVNEGRVYTPEELDSAKKTLLEIQEITARVTTSSRFVLPKPGQPTPLNRIETTNVDTRPIEASEPGPSTVPA